jgi:hypothetical protein
MVEVTVVIKVRNSADADKTASMIESNLRDAVGHIPGASIDMCWGEKTEDAESDEEGKFY